MSIFWSRIQLRNTTSCCMSFVSSNLEHILGLFYDLGTFEENLQNNGVILNLVLMFPQSCAFLARIA